MHIQSTPFFSFFLEMGAEQSYCELSELADLHMHYSDQTLPNPPQSISRVFVGVEHVT